MTDHQYYMTTPPWQIARSGISLDAMTLPSTTQSGTRIRFESGTNGDKHTLARLIAAAPEMYRALHQIGFEPLTKNAEASACACLEEATRIARSVLDSIDSPNPT